MTAVSAVFFVALCLRRFMGDAGGGLLAGPIEDFLGFAPALVLLAVTLAWCSIWLLHGALPDLGKRATRVFLLVVCVAICVNLHADGRGAPHGWFGYQLAVRIQHAFGYPAAVLAMVVLTLASLLLATDWFFSRYLGLAEGPGPEATAARAALRRKAASGGGSGGPRRDRDRDRGREAERRGPIARPGEGVERAAEEHLKTLSSAFDVEPTEALPGTGLPRSQGTTVSDSPAADESGFRVVGRRRGSGRISLDSLRDENEGLREDEGGSRRSRRARRADAERDHLHGALAEHDAALREALDEVRPSGRASDDDEDEGAIGLDDLAIAAAEVGDRAETEEEDDDLLRAARAAAEDAREALRAQSRKVFADEFFGGQRDEAGGDARADDDAPEADAEDADEDLVGDDLEASDAADGEDEDDVEGDDELEDDESDDELSAEDDDAEYEDGEDEDGEEYEDDDEDTELAADDEAEDDDESDEDYEDDDEEYEDEEDEDYEEDADGEEDGEDLEYEDDDAEDDDAEDDEEEYEDDDGEEETDDGEDELAAGDEADSEASEEPAADRAAAAAKRQQSLFAPADGGAALVDEAAQLVIRSHRASADLLRRRLRVGREEARELLGRLRDLGVIECEDGAEHGEVLLDLDGWNARRKSDAG